MDNTANIKTIKAATHYAFETDKSVSLKGPLGSLWVFDDGTVSNASDMPGTNGYPAYTDAGYLETAKDIAIRYLGM